MSSIVMKILRDMVLVFGILILAWGLGQYQYGKIEHGVGTASGPIDTQMATAGSMISVKVSSNETTETRVVKLESREAFYQNGTLVDKFLVAGGANNGGKGRDVNLMSTAPSLSPTAYRIIVLDADGTTDNIDNIEYTVNYTLWMPNYNIVLIGLVMIVAWFIIRKLAKIQIQGVSVDVGAEPEPAPMARAPPARAPGPMVPPARAPQPGYGRQPPARAPPRGPPAPPPEEYEEPAPPEEAYPPEEEYPPEPEVITPPPRGPAAPQKPMARIRCSACGEIIPIYTKNRPVRITCSNCGRSGTLK